MMPLQYTHSMDTMGGGRQEEAVHCNGQPTELGWLAGWWAGHESIKGRAGGRKERRDDNGKRSTPCFNCRHNCWLRTDSRTTEDEQQTSMTTTTGRRFKEQGRDCN